MLATHHCLSAQEKPGCASQHMPGSVQDEYLNVTTCNASHRTPCAPALGIRDALPPPNLFSNDSHRGLLNLSPESPIGAGLDWRFNLSAHIRSDPEAGEHLNGQVQGSCPLGISSRIAARLCAVAPSSTASCLTTIDSRLQLRLISER
jgi:hypothetical protein